MASITAIRPDGPRTKFPNEVLRQEYEELVVLRNTYKAARKAYVAKLSKIHAALFAER